MTSQSDDARDSALGQPARDADSTAPDPFDDDFTADADFAGEHDDTAVDEEITEHRDRNREPESPRGWSGMES